jgi:hypothetical protein
VSVQQCQDCGALFGYLPRGVCAGCLDAREADFRTVRDWLRANPGASAVDTSAATGVGERRISLFIREGRLSRPAGEGWEHVDEDERRRALIREALPGLAPAPAPAATPPAPGRPRGGGMRVRR